MSRSIRLEQVHIAEPCSADWSSMTGDERTRFCTACGKHVHDLSARSRDEAEALVNASDGKLCVQMTLDYHGRPVTRDGWRAWLVARWVWPAASAAVALTLALIGCRKQMQMSTARGGAMPGQMQTRLAGAPSVQLMGDIDLPPAATQPATQPTAQSSTQPSTQPGILDDRIAPTTAPTTAPATRPDVPVARPVREPGMTVGIIMILPERPANRLPEGSRVD